MKIKSPSSDSEFEAYYNFRWRLLRAPWNQSKGSEKDEYEDRAFHVMATEGGQVIAVGRIHMTNQHTAQIRYMAVDTSYRKSGLGSRILAELEKQAVKKGRKKVMLNARENAMAFYMKCGYIPIERTHTLYDSIAHFRMEKIL